MSKGRVAVLVEANYQDMEVWVLLYRLQEAGYETVVVAPRPGTYQSKHGYPCMAAAVASELDASDFAGVVVPGGWAPDRLRQDPGVTRLVKDLAERGKARYGWVRAGSEAPRLHGWRRS